MGDYYHNIHKICAEQVSYSKIKRNNIKYWVPLDCTTVAMQQQVSCYDIQQMCYSGYTKSSYCHCRGSFDLPQELVGLWDRAGPTPDPPLAGPGSGDI